MLPNTKLPDPSKFVSFFLSKIIAVNRRDASWDPCDALSDLEPKSIKSTMERAILEITECELKGVKRGPGAVLSCDDDFTEIATLEITECELKETEEKSTAIISCDDDFTKTECPLERESTTIILCDDDSMEDECPSERRDDNFNQRPRKSLLELVDDFIGKKLFHSEEDIVEDEHSLKHWGDNLPRENFDQEPKESDSPKKSLPEIIGDFIREKLLFYNEDMKIIFGKCSKFKEELNIEPDRDLFDRYVKSIEVFDSLVSTYAPDANIVIEDLRWGYCSCCGYAMRRIGTKKNVSLSL